MSYEPVIGLNKTHCNKHCNALKNLCSRAPNLRFIQSLVTTKHYLEIGCWQWLLNKTTHKISMIGQISNSDLLNQHVGSGV